VTSLLFTVGKFAIGAYLGTTRIASAYGAAGSVLLLLLWVYYSSLIFFFGAELTRSCAYRYGSMAAPRR
jgi:membrane protein